VEDPSSEEGDFKDFINNDSLKTITNAYVEPSLKQSISGDYFQFIRKGYFCPDKDSASEKLVFNRTVTLKDAWAKEQKKD
jgi:glutaminyl-tRNA synthetase